MHGLIHTEAQNSWKLFQLAASGDGGIVQAFEYVLTLKKKAVECGMKILYWLCKNEVAHFSKFESFKQLCIDLGCRYLKELNVAGNANYFSHRIISEWLDVMSQQIEDECIRESTEEVQQWG